MKTLLIAVFVLVSVSSLKAQRAAPDTSKQSVIYFDADSTLLTKAVFENKFNMGKYTLAIHTGGNKTYMYLTPARTGRQPSKVIPNRSRQ